MAGEFKVIGVSFATESGGTLTVNNSKVRLPSSGNGIEDSSGNSVLSESGGKTSINLTGDFVPSNSFMFRNKVINGGMKIAQRGTSTAFAHDGTTNGYVLDRFRIYLNNTDEYDCTVSQHSMSAAELNTTGHSKALKLLTGTAESAIANDEYVRIDTKLEGQDIQDLQYGTAGAKSSTLSFWVNSSVTGTYGITFYSQSSQARALNATYTINSANTWEKKTITIVGDTVESSPDDNTLGMMVVWSLASGSNYDGVNSTSWSNYTTTNLNGGHQQDGVVTTASAVFYLTGVQWEVGSSATPFEHRPIGMELSLCQRYYQDLGRWLIQGQAYGSGNDGLGYPIRWITTMRAAPQILEQFVTHGGSNADLVFNQITKFGCSPEALKISGNSGTNIYYLTDIQAEAEL